MRLLKIGSISLGLFLAVVIIAAVVIGPVRLDSASIWLDPNNPENYENRGEAHYHADDYGAAIADYGKAIQLNPKYVDAYNDLAWLLATCPDETFRDGKKAVSYATTAYQLSDEKDPGTMDTLAAAYAEAGDFDSAVKWESKCLEAPDLGAAHEADAKSHLALYQSHKPYHKEK